MKRLTINLNDAAKKIYDSIPYHQRSHFVSEAILEYEPDGKRESLTKSEVEEILKPIIERIKALEERKGKK
jgi:hypothetical protein